MRFSISLLNVDIKDTTKLKHERHISRLLQFCIIRASYNKEMVSGDIISLPAFEYIDNLKDMRLINLFYMQIYFLRNQRSVRQRRSINKGPQIFTSYNAK